MLCHMKFRTVLLKNAKPNFYKQQKKENRMFFKMVTNDPLNAVCWRTLFGGFTGVIC